MAQSNGKVSALIVDDDPIIRLLHRRLFLSHGFTVQTAKNGREALNFFASGAKFDVVFIDRDMPIMDGVEVYIFKI